MGETGWQGGPIPDVPQHLKKIGKSGTWKDSTIENKNSYVMPTLRKFIMTKLTILAIALLSVLATPSSAQHVIYNPGWCAQFYPNANCQNYGPGNPYTSYGWRGTYGYRGHRHHYWGHRHYRRHHWY